MRVLITGVAGFIGSHTAEALLARGDEVYGIDNFDPYYDRALKERNLKAVQPHRAFTFEHLDIRDERLRPVMDRWRPNVVVHLAARPGVRASLDNPIESADINVRGTAVVLSAAQRAGVRHVVFASSSSVYGERTQGPFREDDRVDHPISPYAATKKAGELLAHTFAHAYGMSIACLRFFTAYGPRQRPEMAIHAFARSIADGAPVTVFGDGSAQRDFTFVNDVVDGVVRAIDRPLGYRIYNLGRGETCTVAETIELLERHLGKRAICSYEPVAAGDVPLTFADISLARRELGYEPKTPLRDGIPLFVAWFKHGR